MPDAARISDHHLCPLVLPGPVPHVGGPIFTGSMNVIIGHLPAARARDRGVCVPLGPLDQIRKGSATVLINQRDAARRTDPMNHGGIIVAGCPTVIIGDSPQSFTFRAAAKQGTPFCEECERARQAQTHEDHENDDLEPMTDAATLEDPEPQPGAASPRAALMATAPTQSSIADLAGQQNLDDGDNDLRCAARAAVAWNFYLDHAGGKAKPSTIEAQVRGIDMMHPVTLVQIPPTNGGTLFQRAVPGKRNGEYFALDPAISPDALGVSEMVYPLVNGALHPTAVPREKRVVTFPDDAPALGLQSTAAPIDDDWSMPDSPTTTKKIVQCQGGATQLVVPHKFHP